MGLGGMFNSYPNLFEDDNISGPVSGMQQSDPSRITGSNIAENEDLFLDYLNI